MPAERHDSRGIGKRLLSGFLPYLGLVLIWMLLWGQFTWLGLLTGAIVGALVSALFYLPALRISGLIDPWRAAVFVVRLAVDILVASLSVAWVAIGPRRLRANAIIVVPLRTRSDVVITFTAEALSLVPGSLVLDMDRDLGLIQLHILDMGDESHVAVAKKRVLATEARIVRAFGSRDDRERLRAAEAEERAGISSGAAEEGRIP